MGLKKTALRSDLRPVIERARPRDQTGLLEQLKSQDAEVRRWAARDLLAFPDSARHLGQMLCSESLGSVRSALFTTLAGHANEEAVLALLPLLRSEDASLRNSAIESLACMPEVVAPRVAALLKDQDTDVRIFTVNLLTELRHTRLNGWLRQVLDEDTNVNVVAAAIEVMAEVGTVEDLLALRNAQARFADDPFLVFAADLAISRITVP